MGCTARRSEPWQPGTGFPPNLGAEEVLLTLPPRSEEARDQLSLCGWWGHGEQSELRL